MEELVSEFILDNEVETHLLKTGNIFTEKKGTETASKSLFLIIPGNPGIPEYYAQFMYTLWEKSEKKIPVWCVGQAGHVAGPNISNLTWMDILKGRRPGPPYSLGGQIKHKINFIKNNIPKDTKLILIGHSIGCYMILNLLSEITEYHVLRCFLLFPTIERMHQSPNGQFFKPLLNYFRWGILAAVKVLSFLSPQTQRRLVKYHLRSFTAPECSITASLSLFNPSCVDHATFLAKQELAMVDHLQVGLLKQNIQKISFYFGSIDRWCPKEYCFALKRKFPDADIRLCQMDFCHAFVLDAGVEMADIVWDWVREHF